MFTNIRTGGGEGIRYMSEVTWEPKKHNFARSLRKPRYFRRSHLLEIGNLSISAIKGSSERGAGGTWPPRLTLRTSLVGRDKVGDSGSEPISQCFFPSLRIHPCSESVFFSSHDENKLQSIIIACVYFTTEPSFRYWALHHVPQILT